MIRMEPKHRIKTIWIIFMISAFLFQMICSGQDVEAKKISLLKVYFVDVGQGSAIFIQSKNKNTLIDTGDKRYYGKLDAFLSEKKIRTIDQIILTHNDPDHIGNAARLIKTRKVKRVVRARYGYKKKRSTKEVKELDKEILRFNIKTRKVRAGNSISFGGQIKGKVLSPGKDYAKTNQTSLVIHLTYGKNSYLFTGDIYSSNEKELVRKYDIRSTVLQIPHHGSRTSSSEKFLKKVRPRYAVISCGDKNPYGHPQEETLKRIRKYIQDQNLYRTDRDGTVVFTCDRQNLTVQVE